MGFHYSYPYLGPNCFIPSLLHFLQIPSIIGDVIYIHALNKGFLTGINTLISFAYAIVLMESYRNSSFLAWVQNCTLQQGISSRFSFKENLFSLFFNRQLDGLTLNKKPATLATKESSTSAKSCQGPLHFLSFSNFLSSILCCNLSSVMPRGNHV